jgi:hypothetical protein
MTVTVFGRVYDFSNSPAFVKHAIKLITDRWGTNLANAAAYVQHAANDLGRRFGTLG